jgi:hypothetical protein
MECRGQGWDTMRNCPSLFCFLPSKQEDGKEDEEDEGCGWSDEEDEEDEDDKGWVPIAGWDAGAVVTADNVTKGGRVVRGPDWKWVTQDGGAGKVRACKGRRRLACRPRAVGEPLSAALTWDD